MTFNKELESAADHLWNRAMEIYRSAETHEAWTLEIANYTNQLIKELRGVAAPSDTGREQPPDDGRRYCKHCTNRIYFDCVSDARNPKWRHSGSNFVECFGDLDTWAEPAAPGVAPAQAQPEPRMIEYAPKAAPDQWAIVVGNQTICSFDYEHEAKELLDNLKLVWPRASDPQKGQGWVRCSEQMPESSDEIYYEVLINGEEHSFAYYDPAGAKKEKNHSDWCWFDREENAWCHKNRYTHWKFVTPAPP